MKSPDPYAGKIHVTSFVRDGEAFLAVICKQAFSVSLKDGTLALDGLETLQPDLSYQQAPHRIARAVLQGRDLWPDKPCIDLILNADAVAPDNAPVQDMQVKVQFEEKSAAALVFGDRYAFRLRGQLRFSDPQTFSSMPLDDFHAYGGIDPTLMPASLSQAPAVLGMPVPELFPGANPFNPAGLGYWVDAKNFVDGLMLPNVERMHDLLSPERFFVGDPSLWPLAARPICWGFRSLWSFPRCLSINRRPHFLPSSDKAQAVARLSAFQDELSLRPKAGELSVSAKIMQQGARELALPMRSGPLSLKLSGVHANARVQLVIPDDPPKIDIEAKGRRQVLEAKRLTVHLDTRAQRLWLSWTIQCPLDPEAARPGALADLKARYRVFYEGQSLSEACWSAGRAILHA